jgi:hypothetical protein
MRSGTTLFMQWLADTGIAAYPSNLLSRFYNAPVIGAKIQLMLTDPNYNFRDELGDLVQNPSFQSENGKTTGTLSPNEFWYFWRRFLPEPARDDYTDPELMENMDTGTMLKELAGLTDVFGKPFACKAMLFNYNIPFLNNIIPKPVFVYIKRKPIFNMQSVFAAREKQLGSREEWYSFKIREYEELRNLSPEHQVAGQIACMNNAITAGLEEVPDINKLIIDYESFCKDPATVYSDLVSRLNKLGHKTEVSYTGCSEFTANEIWTGSESEAVRYQKIYDSFLH